MAGVLSSPVQSSLHGHGGGLGAASSSGPGGGASQVNTDPFISNALAAVTQRENILLRHQKQSNS